MDNLISNNLYLFEPDAFCGSIVYYEGEYHIFYIANNQTCIRHYQGENLLNLKKKDDIISKYKKILCLCSYVKSGILYVLFSAGKRPKMYIAKSKDWHNFDIDEVEKIKGLGLDSFKIVQSQELMYLMTSEKRGEKCIGIHVSSNPYVWEPMGLALDEKNANIKSPSMIGVNDYQYLIYEFEGIIYAQKGIFNQESGEFIKIDIPCYLDKGNNPKAYVLSNGKIVLISDYNGNIIIQDLGALGGLTLNPNVERLQNLHAKSFDSKLIKTETSLVDEYKKESEYEFDIELPENTSFVLKIRQNVLKQIYVAYNSDYGKVVFSSAALKDDIKQRTKNIGNFNEIKVKIIFSNNIGQVYINGGMAAFTFNAEEFIPDNAVFVASKPTNVKITRYDVIGNVNVSKDLNMHFELL